MELHKALTTCELQHPFFKKERHFFRAASGKTESWQTVLGLIKNQAMTLAQNESPDKLIDNQHTYKDLFKLHRSRLGFGKTTSLDTFEQLLSSQTVAKKI